MMNRTLNTLRKTNLKQRISQRSLFISALNQQRQLRLASTSAGAHIDIRDVYNKRVKEGNQRIMLYTASIVFGFVGLSYCAVPLYELICTQTGLDGT